MKFLGFELRTAAPDTGAAVAQVRDSSPQGPMTNAFNNWVFRKIDPRFYEVLREAIPMNDTAIDKLVSINGRIEIIGDKADCVAELEDFCRFVPVGPNRHGIQEYRKAMWGEGFEQGFGFGELAATPDLKDIEGLRVADSKYIIYWKNADGLPEPWYLYPDKDTGGNRPLVDPADLMGKIINARYGQTLNYNQQDMVKLSPGNKFYLAPRIENSNPYGISLFRAQPWVAQILATLQNSIKNSADRFGDPMYHVHSAGKTPADKIQKLIDDLSAQLTTALSVKRAGGSADIVTAGGEASKVDIKVIGHEGQLFEYEVPMRHAEENVVVSSGLPAWMLGKYWSTTERMAQLEVEMVLADGAMRNETETPGLIRLFSTVLAMRGKKWKTITTDPGKPGDWGFRFIQPNLHNEVQTAQARFLNAQADMMSRGGQPSATVRNEGTEVPVGGQASGGAVTIKSEGMDIQVPLPSPHASLLTPHGRSCSCGASHSELRTLNSELVSKELSRPFPWPELDAIEAEYERDLKYDWNELKKKVFDIVGLKIPEEQGKVQSPHSSPLTPHGSKAFAFDDAQRQKIMAALDEFLGWNDPADPDGTVRWGYMQSYSLGLIKAAQLMGKERPLLDILKNTGIFDELVNSGFELVKNDATRAITGGIIPAMERFVVEGANPRDAARELDWLFNGMNSDWERLARTEMGGAAEQAKRDEWEARGVGVENFINGPRDIHPRCRCSNSVRQEGGKWVVVFVPAPDACPACFAAAEGTKRA